VSTKTEGTSCAPWPEHQADAAALHALLERVTQLAARLSAMLSAIVGRACELDRPRGEPPRPPMPILAVVERPADPEPGPGPGDPRHRLTPRERQVLDLVADGQSNKEIARSLGIAGATARCHVQNMLTKLGVGSRVHAAALALPPAPHADAAAEQPAGSPRFRDLTLRETEVLRALAAGLGQREIARRLYLSPHTVRTHVQRLLAKLGVHSVLGALALARREGLPPAEAAGRPG